MAESDVAVADDFAVLAESTRVIEHGLADWRCAAVNTQRLFAACLDHVIGNRDVR